MIFIIGNLEDNESPSAFQCAEDLLTINNEYSVNQARIKACLPPTISDLEYLNFSYALMGLCNKIYLVKGWEKSYIAKKQLVFALNHCYDIYLEGDQNAY